MCLDASLNISECLHSFLLHDIRNLKRYLYPPVPLKNCLQILRRMNSMALYASEGIPFPKPCFSQGPSHPLPPQLQKFLNLELATPSIGTVSQIQPVPCQSRHSYGYLCMQILPSCIFLAPVHNVRVASRPREKQPVPCLEA